MHYIAKDWTELDFSEVDFDDPEWSWGRSDKPGRHPEFYIAFRPYVDNGPPWGQETRYELPPCVSKMLALQEEHGKAEIRATILLALGINR